MSPNIPHLLCVPNVTLSVAKYNHVVSYICSPKMAAPSILGTFGGGEAFLSFLFSFSEDLCLAGGPSLGLYSGGLLAWL